MRILLIFLLAICSTVSAGEFKLGAGYANVRQALHFSPTIEFNQHSAIIEGQYWSDFFFGGRLAVLRSVESPDAFDTEGKKYTNKINAGWSLELGGRIPLGNCGLQLTAGITEYHTTWKIDGVEPAWSRGTDSHKPSWTVGASCKMTERLDLQTSYSYMYDKEKEGYGTERTENIALIILWRF